MRVFINDKSFKFPATQVNLDALAVFDLKSIAQHHKHAVFFMLSLFKIAIDFKKVDGGLFELDNKESDIELKDEPQVTKKQKYYIQDKSFIAIVSFCMLCYAKNQ